MVGAVGGVGASTLAALLAREPAGSGRRVVLVDLHLAHGGIDVLLGAERASGARWPDLAGVRGTLAPDDLDGLLPLWRGVEVLSAGRPAAAGGASPPVGPPVPWPAVVAVWQALVASGRDVVVDVPAHAVAQDDGAAVLLHGATVLVMTGQDVLGVAGAVAVCDAIPQARTRLVLRRRAGARVPAAEAARALAVPLAGLVPTDRGIAGATDRGLGPVVGAWSPLGRAVRRLARDDA